MRPLTCSLFCTLLLLGCGEDSIAPEPADTSDGEASDTNDDGVDVNDDSETDGVSDTDGGLELPTGRWDFTIEQDVEGRVVERSVIVAVPDGIESQRLYPMVFAFHGNGGSPQGFVNELGGLVEQGEFVGVYLEGVENSWNMGREDSQADDTAFVNQVVEHLTRYQNLDFDRIYGYGFSNGSGIIHKIAVEWQVFRAIAGFASQLLEGGAPTQTTAPVSVLQMHDVGDGVIPYDGGLSNATGHTFVSAEESAAIWAEHNGCDPEPTITEIMGGHQRYAFDDCSNGTQVVHYKTFGAGHGVPDDMGRSGAELAWEFLKVQL